MRAITERELSFALNCLSIDAKVETPDFELAEKLVDKVFENRGTHPSLTGNSVEPKIVVSIQVACTLQKGDVFEVVPQLEGKHTHYSLYLRYHDGTTSHVEDFPRNKGRAIDSAFREAVFASIEHNVPIEPILQ